MPPRPPSPLCGVGVKQPNLYVMTSQISRHSQSGLRRATLDNATLDVNDDLSHFCPSEGGTGRLRGVLQTGFGHLPGSRLVLEKDYG